MFCKFGDIVYFTIIISVVMMYLFRESLLDKN